MRTSPEVCEVRPSAREGPELAWKRVRIAAGALSRSSLFNRARAIYAENRRDWEMPLNLWQKFQVSSLLALEDFAVGKFPPKWSDRAATFAAEIAVRDSLPGISSDRFFEYEMRKPFWTGAQTRQYLRAFSDLTRAFEKLGIVPPQKLLELGCGAGWMSQFLALLGYDVLGTTLSPLDVADAQRRIAAIEAMGLRAKLRFAESPMEEADRVAGSETFDAAFVFEALHHAHHWQAAVAAAHRMLKPGGWLIIANEPNLSETWRSYRVAKISNTREIGFWRPTLMRGLKEASFREIRTVRNRFGFLITPHWIAARK